MAKYRIITNRSSFIAQVSRWWWPIWADLKGYSTLYSVGEEKALRWCEEAIERHKRGEPVEPPEWTVVKPASGQDSGK